MPQQDLTEKEKQFLALAIQGLCMRQGPPMFPFAIALTEKLGIQHYLEEYLQSWLTFSQKEVPT